MDPADGTSRNQTDRAARDRRTALVAYGLYLGASLLPLLAVVALVLNYLRRGVAGEPVVGSHHAWMIRTFWWSVLWLLVAAITSGVYVGAAVAAVAWVWWIYRQLKGLLALLDGQSMPT